MARIEIPDRHKDAFRALANMSDKRARELIAAIKSSSPTLTAPQLANQVTAQMPSELSADADAIVRAIVPLIALRAPGESAESFAEIVADSLTEHSDIVSKSKRGNLESRLLELFDIEAPLDTTSKAQYVLWENERVYCSSRVITDIRPIYNRDPSEYPQAAVVVHQLKIVFHQDQAHKEFFVALTNDEVVSLRKVLERAEAKAVSAQSMIQRSEVRYLGPEDK